MGNRVTRQQMKELMKLASLTPQDLGLPADLRVGPGARRKGRKSNCHARVDVEADNEPKPPGTTIASGVILGRPVPWKAPDTSGRQSPEYRTYRDWRGTVAQFARVGMGGRKPYAGPVEVSFVFHFCPNGRTLPDTTNVQKSTEDGLQGVVYVNDSQVVRIRSERVVEPGTREMVEYRVTAL